MIRGDRRPKDFYLVDNLKGRTVYEIGKYSYGSPVVCDWYDGSKLTIGNYCSIAEGTKILLSGNHHFDWVTTYPFLCNPEFVDEEDFNVEGAITKYIVKKGDIVIGNDVWIGNSAIILSNLTIGDGAVVGAGSVVTKDIEPYAISAGNPAHLIRKRFDDETIKELLEIRWWEWPIEVILVNIQLLNVYPTRESLAAMRSIRETL